METVLHKMWVTLFKRYLSRPLEFFNTDKSSPLISINLTFTERRDNCLSPNIIDQSSCEKPKIESKNTNCT